MTKPPLTFEQSARRRLIDSYRRLGEFIGMDNGTMIAMELDFLVRHTISAYGADTVGKVFAERIAKSERAAGGWCIACIGSPNKVASEDGVMSAAPICEECKNVVVRSAERWGVTDEEEAQQ